MSHSYAAEADRWYSYEEEQAAREPARGYVCIGCGRVMPARMADYAPRCEECWSDYAASLQERGA